MTNREKVLSTLRLSTSPLDDDELARRAGVSPRQQVNQICRGLVQEGLLTRVSGPDGKIVNALRGTDAAQATSHGAASGAAESDTTPARALPPGDSSEQRRAERAMLDALGERQACRLVGREPGTVGGNPAVVMKLGGRLCVGGSGRTEGGMLGHRRHATTRSTTKGFVPTNAAAASRLIMHLWRESPFTPTLGPTRLPRSATAPACSSRGSSRTTASHDPYRREPSPRRTRPRDTTARSRWELSSCEPSRPSRSGGTIRPGPSSRPFPPPYS